MRPALDCLQGLGVEIDIAEAERRACERGDAVGKIEGVRVDLFVNSIPLHNDAFRRRQKVDLAGKPIWILSAEDLLVSKLMFFRPKDLDDCSRMVALQGDRLDMAYARRQLAAHVGEDDLRLEALAEMLTAAAE